MSNITKNAIAKAKSKLKQNGFLPSQITYTKVKENSNKSLKELLDEIGKSSELDVENPSSGKVSSDNTLEIVSQPLSQNVVKSSAGGEVSQSGASNYTDPSTTTFDLSPEALKEKLLNGTRYSYKPTTGSDGNDLTQDSNLQNKVSTAENNNSDGDLDDKTDKMKTLDDLLKKVYEITDKYSNITDRDYYSELLPELKTSLGLTKLDDIEIDEDKLREEITNALTKTKENNAEKLKTDTEIKINDILNELESKRANATATASEIEDIYNTAKEDTSTEALKRGLQRSSIVLLQLNGLDKAKAESLSDLAKTLSAELQSGEEKIAQLNRELDQSLEALDLELATEIQTELDNEIEKLNEKRKEIITFNNNVEKIEAEYNLKASASTEDYLKLEESLAEKYKGVAYKDKMTEITEACKEYFGSLDRDTALKELSKNDDLIKALGERFYDIYYFIINNKQKNEE